MNKLSDTNFTLDDSYIAIVLAGQRNLSDSVAAAHGLRAKALVPALGAPLIDHVVTALKRSESIGRIILVEDQSLEPIKTAKGVEKAVTEGDAHLTPASSSMCDSVIQVLSTLPPEAKCLVTTADNALLTPEIISEFLANAIDAEIAIGVVPKRTIDARYRGIPCAYFPFEDTEVASAKLVAIHCPGGAKAIEALRCIEEHRMNPRRLFSTLGIASRIACALRLLSLKGAFDRLSKRLDMTIRPVLLSQPEAAIDVDTIADLLLVDGILARRSCYDDIALPAETHHECPKHGAANQTHPKATWQEVLDAMCEA